jgi:glutamine---fructose-6-phosphate transaminase (isomerizing)
MCGIFGHVGAKNALHTCLKGLKRLEYRGYDSAGIAGISGGNLYCFKEIGNVSSLEKALQNVLLPLETAIAHTRWATHGKVSRENAHPHFDQAGSIALVHNGILENHAELRDLLKGRGVSFKSETDTEVIIQLISHFYRDDLVAATQQALSLMKGFWALALIHCNYPDRILTTTRQNPLVLGLSIETKEAFVSSDPYAFEEPNLDIYFLKDGEIALLYRDRLEVFDLESCPVMKSPEQLNLSRVEISKNGFEHFMLKEIFEQPITLQNAFHNRLLPDFGTAQFEQISLSTQELLSVERILILGCGSSWHAAELAGMLLEELAGIPAQAAIASEFRCRNPIISAGTLVIAISQSGETLDTLAAIREAKSKGAKILAVCNIPSSPLVRSADATILLRAGPEISVCSTKAFTSQLIVLILFALQMARLRHLHKEEGQYFLEELSRLPSLVQQVLDQYGTIAKLASKYAQFDRFFFLGRHYMYPTSLEGALKLKEISYSTAMGYPAGELKHGPIALVDEQCAIIGMGGNLRTYEKFLNNMMEVKARGGVLLALVPEGAAQIEQIADDVLFLPSVGDALASIPYSVACQLFAYSIAKERGTDIDQPRNLAKSVTVE